MEMDSCATAMPASMTFRSWLHSASFTGRWDQGQRNIQISMISAFEGDLPLLGMVNEWLSVFVVKAIRRGLEAFYRDTMLIDHLTAKISSDQQQPTH